MKTIFNESYNLLIECLKKERKKRNLTQAQLASLIGRDQTYVSKYERCEKRLDVIEVRTICLALGIEFTKFISDFENLLKKKGYEDE
ncbi:helix-turn-helix domain-containing protein [Parageobacillus thermoglucosidasius]|uniref:helix-turn-helix domain-containing protein n=1 Tax=Parageobacillus thermoglucosidasius TaxID=1426 RepID=UPI003B67522B